MKKNYNAIATSALIKKSRKLYKSKTINKLEHMKNMNYILQKMDALFVGQKQCDLIIDIIGVNSNINDVSILVDRLITLIN